jgi:hypothetical protein
MKGTNRLDLLAALNPGEPVPASCYRAIAELLAGIRPLDDTIIVKYLDDGIQIRINPDAQFLAELSAQPFQITLDDATHWSCSAGSVYERAGQLAVSAVSAVEITATSWIYVAITISTAGSVSAGTITAATGSEPAYWTRNGSNETVISLIIGKITVSTEKCVVIVLHQTLVCQEICMIILTRSNQSQRSNTTKRTAYFVNPIGRVSTS